jgi:hypothetical protein
MLELLGDFWAFTKSRRKYWMLPLLLVLLAFGSLIIVAQASAVAPFIYTLF